jgi:signal recognition particle receptor subunit alpha
LYKDQLSNTRTTNINCPFDPYFDRQIQELEKSGLVATPAVTVSGPDTGAINESDANGNDTPSDGEFVAVSRPMLPASPDSSRPASPANRLLTAKGAPGGRGSRKARKAAAASVAALNGFPVSSGDESASQRSKSGQKGKKMRKWGADGLEDDGDNNALDFSEQPKDSSVGTTMQEIDSSSWGTRTADGKFMLKDIGEEMNEILGTASEKNGATQKPTGLVGSGLGAIGGLFRNVVGGKTLTKDDLEKSLKGMEDHLMKKNVAREAAIRLCESIERDLVGMKTNSFTSMFHPLQIYKSTAANPRIQVSKRPSVKLWNPLSAKCSHQQLLSIFSTKSNPSKANDHMSSP